MYKFKHISTILLLIIAPSLWAQEDVLETKDGVFTRSIVTENDTLPFITLDKVDIYPPFEFKTIREKKRFYRLVYNIKKAYPYAKIASAKLKEIEAGLDTIIGKQQQKKYIKHEEKAMKAQFEGELRKLTISQGRILIKLIDRETGDTSYELVKELRGSFSAFMWQSLARLFGSNLKSEYDAEGNDKTIERIVVMIENGQL